MSTVKELEKLLEDATEANALSIALRLADARRKEALEKAQEKQSNTFIKLIQQNTDHLKANNVAYKRDNKVVEEKVEVTTDAVKAAVEAGTVAKKATKKAAKKTASKE